MNILLLNRRKKRIGVRKIKAILKAVLGDLGHEESEISLLLTNDREIRELNKTYRNLDKPTDVLSFPTNDATFIGDIAISVDRAVEQAGNGGITLHEELARLVIHGTLHLLGHEHEQGGYRARKMRREEKRLMALITDAGLTA